jgi:hypothetical protein
MLPVRKVNKCVLCYRDDGGYDDCITDGMVMINTVTDYISFHHQTSFIIVIYFYYVVRYLCTCFRIH